jgi:hypothetical protein
MPESGAGKAAAYLVVNDNSTLGRTDLHSGCFGLFEVSVELPDPMHGIELDPFGNPANPIVYDYSAEPSASADKSVPCAVRTNRIHW